MRKIGTFLLVIALWLGIASVAFAGAWLNHRYDAAHTANNATEVIDPSTLTWKWSKFIGNVLVGYWSLPVVDRSRFFVGADDGQGKWLKAFRLSNGGELWKKPVATKQLPQGPVMDGTRVYIAGGTSHTGTLTLTQQTGPISGRPVRQATEITLVVHPSLQGVLST